MQNVLTEMYIFMSLLFISELINNCANFLDKMVFSIGLLTDSEY